MIDKRKCLSMQNEASHIKWIFYFCFCISWKWSFPFVCLFTGNCCVLYMKPCTNISHYCPNCKFVSQFVRLPCRSTDFFCSEWNLGKALIGTYGWGAQIFSSTIQDIWAEDNIRNQGCTYFSLVGAFFIHSLTAVFYFSNIFHLIFGFVPKVLGFIFKFTMNIWTCPRTVHRVRSFTLICSIQVFVE